MLLKSVVEGVNPIIIVKCRARMLWSTLQGMVWMPRQSLFTVFKPHHPLKQQQGPAHRQLLMQTGSRKRRRSMCTT